MSINNVFTEPGVFSQFKPTRTFPVLPGGVRVAALVGTGRTTHIVSAEEVTRGGSVNGSDALAHTATSLGATIIDEDLQVYNLTTDYVLTGGAVAWTPAVAAFLQGTTDFVATPVTKVSLVGTTFKITVAGGSEQTYTFVSGDFVGPNVTASEVATALAGFTGVSVTVVTNEIKIQTTATNNTSLLIGDGTSNSLIGFVVGSFQESSKEPIATKKYTVSYEYAKVTADYVPQFYFSMADVVADYGDVSLSNTLSLGSEIVFTQGASAICLVQCNPADGSSLNQFKQAINKLAATNGINIVVPLSNDTSLHSFLKAHVDAASSITERKERTAIVSMPAPQTVASMSAQAQALVDKRMVLISANQVSYFIGNDSVATVLNGSYVAAAIAGVRTSRSFDVADPLTHKTLAGFSDMPDTLLRQEKITLLSKGVMVIENNSGIIRVLQQVTTDTSTRENNEYSVVEIIDFVASNSRRILENIFIGQKILAGTSSQVKSTETTVLSNLVTSEIIVAFQNVQAAVDNLDPTQIDVSFEIAPVFPLNYILITFSLSPNQ